MHTMIRFKKVFVIIVPSCSSLTVGKYSGQQVARRMILGVADNRDAPAVGTYGLALRHCVDV